MPLSCHSYQSSNSSSLSILTEHQTRHNPVNCFIKKSMPWPFLIQRMFLKQISKLPLKPDFCLEILLTTLLDLHARNISVTYRQNLPIVKLVVKRFSNRKICKATNQKAGASFYPQGHSLNNLCRRPFCNVKYLFSRPSVFRAAFFLSLSCNQIFCWTLGA